MLIFDGYRSHITQDFIDYCWSHRIWPFLLPAHTTHLTQPLDVGVFQSFKHNFKQCICEEVFLGATEILKTNFFSFFQKFSNKTFTPKLCKAAFRKTGLIPFNPKLVLDKMKAYGGIQNAVEAEEVAISRESTPGFATPLPRLWSEFMTPITNTQRKRGSEYVKERMVAGPITPTVIRVMEKVQKGSDKMILEGQLSKELLKATTTAGAKRKA